MSEKHPRCPAPNFNEVKIKTTHYDNGGVESKTPYVSDKQHGLQTGWDDDGTKWWTALWKDGEKHGLETRWYKNESKSSITMWRDGKKHGVDTWWREDGAKRLERLFAPTGEYSRMVWDKEGNVIVADFPNPTINPPINSAINSSRKINKLK